MEQSKNKVFKCPTCNKTYKTEKSLRRHVRTEHERVVVYSCSKCTRTFKRPDHRNRHEKTCSGEDHVCQICEKRCSTKQGLHRHLRIHETTPDPAARPAPTKRKKTAAASIASPPKRPKCMPRGYCCRRCDERFSNRHDLYLHGMTQHFQSGARLQQPPWDRNENPPWVSEEDGSVNEDLKLVYESNEPLMLERHRLGPVQSVYNFPIGNDFTLEQLTTYIAQIYEQQQHAFRLNIMFGFILQNRETGQYRYFKPFSNEAVLETPPFISRRSDLTKLGVYLDKLDVTSEMMKSRPNTKWFVVLLTNVQFDITSSTYPIGRGSIPKYIIRKNKSLYPLVMNAHTGRPYTDNLCAFRCLALHKGFDIEGLDAPARQYYEQWLAFRRIQPKEFRGLSLEEFPDFENVFDVNLEVYSLQSTGQHALSVYKSRRRYGSTMFVNLYEYHMSYIRDFSLYAQKFQCKSCERHFKNAYRLHRHQNSCVNKTKYVYPGGFYRQRETVFDRLEQFGIFVSHADRTFEWFICYDCEAMLRKVDERPTPNLRWSHEHVPISVSICSNVEGHTKAFCIVHPTPDKLVESMVAAMQEIASKMSEYSEDKWGWVLTEIQEKLENKNYGSNLLGLDLDIGEEEDGRCKALEKLMNDFATYMHRIPVFGFNSSNYDTNLMKKYLARHLELHATTREAFVIKRNNSYLCIASEQLKFLDISQFLAAGSSYDKFLKAYHVEEREGFFPYEWFDDISKLDEPVLPSHEDFFSNLKNCNITDEQYEFCRQTWVENDMETFRDYLVWYNNRDVEPFVTAVTRIQEFYFEKHIDVFKTAISVPGIARQLLFNTAKDANVNFALFNSKDKDLYDTIKQNIVGGPSIVFNRHHKAGTTRIRNNKICRSILGFDANALYLYCIGKEMPVGSFVRRWAKNEFVAEVRDRFVSATNWMDWLNLTEGYDILHWQNHGSEIRIGRYPVDGYQFSTTDGPTSYLFHGCWFHGHLCDVTKNVKDKKWLETREKKYKKTQEITEYLRRKGCAVVEMYECEFRVYCKENPEIYGFINSRRPEFFQQHRYKKIAEDVLLKAVVDEEIFGMFEVDIEVPDHWPDNFIPKNKDLSPYEYFEEMSPLFCNVEVPHSAIGQHMHEYVRKRNMSTAPRRLLVGGMSARQILLATPLLKWYLDHGMVVTKIYQVIEFRKERCFEEFVHDVSEARRRGDVDPDTAIIADTMKVIGNSAYGSMIMDKTKHRTVKYVEGENETCLLVNEPRFRKLTCLNDVEQYYEIEMAKRKITLDLPHQLGYFVLQYAKLRMLEFYYDFMDVYVERADFAYTEMDTDSAYMGITGNSLDEIVKPSMREKFERGLKGFCSDGVEADAEHHWLPRTCCVIHSNYDKRSPGLFKLEYKGDEMISLCSKCYIIQKTKLIRPSSAQTVAYKLLRKALRAKPRTLKRIERRKLEYKFTSKGVSKRRVKTPLSTFRYVLNSGKSQAGINLGFRVRNNTVYTYAQKKYGFGYFYCKRRVLADGGRTAPLDIVLCPK